MLKRLSVLVFFLQGLTVSVAAETGLPPEVVQMAKIHHCAIIGDFGLKYGPTANMLVYENEARNSLYFWSQNIKTKDYILAHLYRLKNTSPWRYEIVLEVDSYNFTGNLSFSTEPDLKLDHLVDIKQFKPGPKNVSPKGKLLRTGDDSLNRVLYKYKGKWFVLSRC